MELVCKRLAHMEQICETLEMDVCNRLYIRDFKRNCLRQMQAPVATTATLGRRSANVCRRTATLEPRPWTLDPGPWTLDPGPWTLDPEPLTLDPGS